MEQQYCYGCMRPKTQKPVCEHCGFDERTQNAVHQLPIGTVLQDQYVIGRVLGQGGFGITYIGWDKHLAIPIAIKEYFPSGAVHRQSTVNLGVTCYTGVETETFASHRDRFLKEARTLAQLSGVPEIVQVRNFFTLNNTAYIIMEYVQGITLKDYLRRLRRPLQEQELLKVMQPVLRALSKVHSKHLIHRDISPDNIMLPVGGGVKLIDFGTVRNNDDSMRTKSTESILKPGFAPIEQYQSRGNLGPWTDVYALCATMHYCLTGKIPEDALARLETGNQLTYLQSVPSISSRMKSILQKGLAIRISDRIQSVEELYQYLYGQTLVQTYGNTGSGPSAGISAPVQPPRPEPVPRPEPKPQPKPQPKPAPEQTEPVSRKLFDGFKGIVPDSVLEHCESIAHSPILVETYLQQCVTMSRIMDSVAQQMLLHYKKNYVPRPAPAAPKKQDKTRTSSDGSVFGGFRGEISGTVLDYCEANYKSPVLVETHLRQCVIQKRITQAQADAILEHYRPIREARTNRQGKMIFCSECGQEMPAGSRFCYQCGTGLKPADPNSYPRWTCSVCREQILPNSKYCRSCGKPVTDPIIQQHPENACHSCGAPLLPGSKFCVSCGKPVFQGNRRYPEGQCQSCGKPLSPNAKFCVYCGTPVT